VSVSAIPVLGGPLPPLTPNPIPAGLLMSPQQFAFRYTPTLTPVVCSPGLFSLDPIKMFGGFDFGLPTVPRTPDLVQLLGLAMQQFGAITTPLGPIVTGLKTTKAIVDLVINMPADMAALIAFDPSPLANHVAAVVAASSDLVALAIFPVQMAKMIRGVLTLLIAYLNALRSQIVSLITRITNVNALIAKATAAGMALLLANSQCALARLTAKADAMNAFLQSVGLALVAINIILCFVTGGHLPLIPVIDPSSLVAEIFDPVILVLTTIRDAIPDLSGFALTC
jgi:hypothetical protein